MSGAGSSGHARRVRGDVIRSRGATGTEYVFRIDDPTPHIIPSPESRRKIKILFESKEGILENIQTSPTVEHCRTYVIKDTFPPLVEDDKFTDMIETYFSLKENPLMQGFKRQTEAEEEKMKKTKQDWVKWSKSNSISAMCAVTEHVALTSFFGMRLGNFDRFAGKDLTRVGLVLNVTWEAPMFADFTNVNYRIPIADDKTLDLKKYFHVVADKINSVSKAGKLTVVYCLMGKSRSVTFILAYLIKYHTNSLSEAFTGLYSRRSWIKPRLTFLKQLTEFEKDCHSRNGLTAEEARSKETEWIPYGTDPNAQVKVPKFLTEQQNLSNLRDYYYENNKPIVPTQQAAASSSAQ